MGHHHIPHSAVEHVKKAVEEHPTGAIVGGAVGALLGGLGLAAVIGSGPIGWLVAIGAGVMAGADAEKDIRANKK